MVNNVAGQSRLRTRYALIGTGARAEMYVRAMFGPYSDVAELRVLCDVNRGRLDYYEELIGELAAGRAVALARGGPAELEQLIRDEGIERVVITSPDHTHSEFVVRSLKSGAEVIVEKPLTIDVPGCRAIVKAVDDTGGVVVVTFNYRYSPRNSALREVIQSGSIGTVTSVHYEWVLDTSHGADYFRRWHRQKSSSGGLLVHKASHHFDLVNWWIDDVPVRVFASGGLRFYGQANAAERGLSRRPERGTPERGTHDGARDPFALNLREDDHLRRLYLDNEAYDGYLRDLDVFSDGITIEDNMGAIVDYLGGATLTYSLNAHCPWEGYRVAVNGTEGRAELEVVERAAILPDDTGRVTVDPTARPASDYRGGERTPGERLLLQRHWDVARRVEIPVGEGSHGGGDAMLLSDVFRGPGDDPLKRPASYLDGLRSVAVGIAGNQSMATGAPVRIDDLELGVDLSGRHQLGAEDKSPV